MAVFHYGGQAVIEGVMIRGRKNMVTAVRKPDGEIVVDRQILHPAYTGWMRATPLLRGIIVLIESLVLGVQTLMYSANVALTDEEKEKEKKKDVAGGGLIWLTLIVSLAFSVAVFFLAPLFLTRLFLSSTSVWFYIVEGLVRIVIFILYLRLITLMPDIKRVFAYHGAEHKSVNGYEAGSPLEIEPLKKYSKAHIRCGGSFLVVVLIIAIVVFTLVGIARPSLLLTILSRIVFVPVIAALSYEVIYFGARHAGNVIVRILLAPGMWIQSLTTREPDDKQLEVAIAAMKGAIEGDQEAEPAVQPAD